MSTPQGNIKLWRNCTWKNEEEKLAFFNHYFKNSKMVINRIDNKVKHIKEGLLDFIVKGKIKLKDNKTRPITIQDITRKLKML